MFYYRWQCHPAAIPKEAFSRTTGRHEFLGALRLQINNLPNTFSKPPTSNFTHVIRKKYSRVYDMLFSYSCFPWNRMFFPGIGGCRSRTASAEVQLCLCPAMLAASPACSCEPFCIKLNHEAGRGPGKIHSFQKISLLQRNRYKNMTLEAHTNICLSTGCQTGKLGADLVTHTLELVRSLFRGMRR